MRKGDECRELEQLSDQYNDNELPRETRLRLLRHLAECESCADWIEERRYARETLRRSVIGCIAPMAVRLRVLAEIRSCGI
jgi:hypothetical protein